MQAIEENRTKKVYSYIWSLNKQAKSASSSHYEAMQEAIEEKIVQGQAGIEIGCGPGYDAYIMANSNRGVKIVGIDISDGVFVAAASASLLKNLSVLKGSALDIPFKNNSFDFAYSFGVLHHTLDPKRAMAEIARVVKAGAPLYVYLYEDHEDNPFKYLPLKLITMIRAITTRLPLRFLYALSFLSSPFIVLFFSFPARILKKFKFSFSVAEKMPFNFGTNLFSLTHDLYDRFGAPIEYRFNKRGIFSLFEENGFVNVKVTKIRSIAGWVARGYKK